MPATGASETSGRSRISRSLPLSPNGKHLNISADRENLNQDMHLSEEHNITLKFD